MSKPNKNGFAGMINSPLLDEPIALVADDEKIQNLECCFAVLTVGKGMTVPRIIMEREVFFDFMRGSKKAQLILFHEIGHFYNKDLINYNDGYYPERLEKAKEHVILKMEIQADLFAYKYLGKEVAIQGLQELKDEIMIENDEDALAASELDDRIKIIMDK